MLRTHPRTRKWAISLSKNSAVLTAGKSPQLGSSSSHHRARYSCSSPRAVADGCGHPLISCYRIAGLQGIQVLPVAHWQVTVSTLSPNLSQQAAEMPCKEDLQKTHLRLHVFYSDILHCCVQIIALHAGGFQQVDQQRGRLFQLWVPRLHAIALHGYQDGWPQDTSLKSHSQDTYQLEYPRLHAGFLPPPD